MIKCERGNLQMRGSAIALRGECVCILREMRKVLGGQYEKERVEEKLQFMVELSNLDDEQIKAKTRALQEELIENMLKEIFG